MVYVASVSEAKTDVGHHAIFFIPSDDFRTEKAIVTELFMKPYDTINNIRYLRGIAGEVRTTFDTTLTKDEALTNVKYKRGTTYFIVGKNCQNFASDFMKILKERLPLP